MVSDDDELSEERQTCIVTNEDDMMSANAEDILAVRCCKQGGILCECTKSYIP